LRGSAGLVSVGAVLTAGVPGAMRGRRGRRPLPCGFRGRAARGLVRCPGGDTNSGKLGHRRCRAAEWRGCLPGVARFSWVSAGCPARVGRGGVRWCCADSRGAGRDARAAWRPASAAQLPGFGSGEGWCGARMTRTQEKLGWGRPAAVQTRESSRRRARSSCVSAGGSGPQAVNSAPRRAHRSRPTNRGPRPAWRRHYLRKTGAPALTSCGMTRVFAAGRAVFL